MTEERCWCYTVPAFSTAPAGRHACGSAQLRAGTPIIARLREKVKRMLRESETESYQFECGAPVFGDVLETTRPDYCLMMLALHEELAKIPDAPQWLELVMQGEKPRKAARRLHRGWTWYCRVLDACRRVLLE